MFSGEMTNRELVIAQATVEFVKYVHEFYGRNGLYDMGATYQQICLAISQLLTVHKTNVAFDSVDRERVRDIMIERFGLKFPGE